MRRYLTILLLLILSATPSWAQTFRWDGGGPNNFLESGANWEDDVAPDPNDPPQLIFDGATRTTPVAGLPRDVFRLEFWSDDADFVHSGQQLSMYGGVKNFSERLHTVTNPISQMANGFYVSHGYLRITGSIGLNNNVITIIETLSNPGVVDLAGTVLLGFIDVDLDGVLKLSGEILCDVDNLDGTLIVATDTPQPPGSVLQFGAGTFLQAEGDHNCLNSLQLSGPLTYEGGGDLQMGNGIRGSGELVIDGDGTLGLGGGYLFTFTDPVTIKSGRLELTGSQPGVPMLSGPITLGDGVGPAGDAVLDIAHSGIVQTEFGWIPVIDSDARLELAGNHTVTEVVLDGGQFVCAGQFQTEFVDVRASSRTALISGGWDTPFPGGLDGVEVEDGPADPDVKILGRRVGPGGLLISGGGQVYMGGDPTPGEGRIKIDGSSLTLSRSNATHSALPEFEAIDSAIFAEFSFQFGSSCQTTLTRSTVNAGSFSTQEVGDLVLDGATVNDFQGPLKVYGDIDVLSSSTLDGDVFFPLGDVTIDVANSETLTARDINAENVTLHGFGTVACRSVPDGDVFLHDEMILRSSGEFASIICNGQNKIDVPLDGGANVLAVSGTLALNNSAILRLTLKDTEDYSRVNVTGVFAQNGVANLDGSLVVELDPAAAIAAGDEFLLLSASTLTGNFSGVSLPAPPAPEQTWDLTIDYEAGLVVLRLESEATPVEETPGAIPTELALRAAPNPFNPRTTVHFDLPEPGRARIDVVDVRGRVVAMLEEADLPSGRHTAAFDGRDTAGQALPSGVYFVRLSTRSGSLVRKVTLVQ